MPLLQEALELGEAQEATTEQVEYCHAFLALACVRTGNYEEAVRHYSAASRYDPDDLTYQIGYAEAYLRLGRAVDAERCYRKVLDVAPANVEARIGLAEALTAQGDTGQPQHYESAEREFARAIDLAESTAAPEPERREGSTALNRLQLRHASVRAWLCAREALRGRGRARTLRR